MTTVLISFDFQLFLSAGLFGFCVFVAVLTNGSSYKPMVVHKRALKLKIRQNNLTLVHMSNYTNIIITIYNMSLTYNLQLALDYIMVKFVNRFLI